MFVKPPLSLYIHFPWCVAKCPYCDFNSHVHRGELPQKHYIDLLIGELQQDAKRFDGREIQTIFMGGGTPSLFAPEMIALLLKNIHRLWPVASGAEITLEANPGAVERGSFRGYREAGINRISMGAQSFDPAMLKRLGRIHSPNDTHQAVADLCQAGFDNFNCDLMNQLPGQTVDQAQVDLKTLIELNPNHISLYELTIEPNTVFAKFPPPPLSDAVSEQIHETSLALLKEAGYRQYEVSAFAKPACEGRHNLNYWEFGDYLGIGAGAHSKWTNSNGVIERGENPKLPRDYMAGGVGRSVETIDAARLPFEFCLNALRLSQGFTWEMCEQRTGLARQRLQRSLESAERRGLVVMNEERVCASGLGYRYLNDVLGLLLD